MSSEIQHVKSRCGGGKTQRTIEYLYPFITGNPDEKVIFSSKTKKLTDQSFKNFKSRAHQVADSQIALQRIDTDTVSASSSVRRELDAWLDQQEGGVIFTSHAALRKIDPEKLQNVRLIIDEVPDNLVKHVRVSYEYKDNGSSWETLIKTEFCPGTQYQKVTLDPSASRKEVRRRIDNIRSGIDNSVTREVAELLEFLLAGHEVMYTTAQQTNGKVMSFYLATDWEQLENLVTHSKQMAILSSQLRDTLVGFVLGKVMGTPIVETQIDSEVTLETHHAARAVIYPLVEGNRWSSSFKRANANERLSYWGKAVASTQPVGLYAQQVAQDILQGRPTLLILNTKDPEHECWEGYPYKRITSAAHGQNDHTDYHHATFLSSNRPDKYETHALKLFARSHGLCPDEIIQTVLRERCHETAYQCIARSSVRNPKTGPETQHTLVVPDEAHAEYIAGWFEPGMATIDRTYMHQQRSTTVSEERNEAVFNLIVKIRTEYLAGEAPLKDLRQKYGLDAKKYQRYVNKFRATLEPAGLMARKGLRTTLSRT